MYIDYVLFAVSGVLLLAALLLLIQLLRSRKKSLDFRRLLSEETERLDVMTTLRQIETTKPGAEEPLAETEKLTVAETELLPETELMFQPDAQPATGLEAGLDLSPLAGKYELLREIHGGGMSRVFLARSVKLGSDWIVKYVERTDLAGEAEVLKRLHHISLPPIIDIFPARRGTFLVERYIEGVRAFRGPIAEPGIAGEPDL